MPGLAARRRHPLARRSADGAVRLLQTAWRGDAAVSSYARRITYPLTKTRPLTWPRVARGHTPGNRSGSKGTVDGIVPRTAREEIAPPESAARNVWKKCRRLTPNKKVRRVSVGHRHSSDFHRGHVTQRFMRWPCRSEGGEAAARSPDERNLAHGRR